MEWKGGKDGGGRGTTQQVAATMAVATIFTRHGNDGGNGGSGNNYDSNGDSDSGDATM
jgi:hypothetical protein